VWPGDRLVGHATVTAVRVGATEAEVDLDLSTVNEAEVEVLRGYATATVDLP
jgi:hypothetical protein